MLDDPTLHDFISRYVRDHYKDHDAPLMLAKLGTSIKEEGHQIPDGLTLKQYLFRKFGSELPVIQRSDLPASIAVALPENRTAIEARLRSQTKVEDPSDALRRVPRALLIAFCRHLPANHRIFMRVTPPLRYAIAAPDMPPSGPYVEILPEYRLPGEQISNPATMPTHTIAALRDRIDQWIIANNLAWDVFLVPEKLPSKETRPTEDNALGRLLAAQNVDIRDKILIPGDIALILMSRS